MPLHAESGKTEKSARGTRLDSWKAIAAYLDRGERTVKRWERERGLPAYRVPGGGRACVYAYTGELDGWLGCQHVHGPDSLDKAEEQESAGHLVTAEFVAESSPSAHAPTSEAPARGSSIRRRWLLALTTLLLVSSIEMVVSPAKIKTAELRASNTLRSLFTRSQPRSASDLQKSLAHDLYLKGRYEWNLRTPDSLNRALDYFTQAMVHDPGDARSYAGLADTYLLLREYTTMPENQAYARAIAAAKKAIELDDSLAEAHRALAFAETNGNWDFVNGENEFHRAIELNPTDPIARLWFANTFASPGRFEECLEEINKAQELDPSSPAILADKGILLFKAGKTQEAIELLQEVERTYSEFRSPHQYLMLIGFSLRDYPAYLTEGDKAAHAVNDLGLIDTMARARAGYVQDGERGLLRNLYAAQKKYYLAGTIPGTLLAKTCIRMGKKKEALQLLEDDYARHDGEVLTCLSEPDLLSLKDEPKYQELLKKFNFPAGREHLPLSTPSRASSEPH